MDLQEALERLDEWGASVGLSFNVNKREPLSCSRRRFPRKFSYSINGAVLVSVNWACDLGFVFVSSLQCSKARIGHIWTSPLRY